MGKTARVLLAMMMTCGVALVAGAAPAHADVRRCLSSAPVTPGDFQALTGSRDTTFGVGDITSAVRLPDGRFFYALGDTAYDTVEPDGSTGPIQGFGNNSAWVQAGNCFTLLNHAGPGSRSWIVPPEQDGSFYWPGASVVVGSRLYVFMQRLRPHGAFGLSLGSVVAEFDLPSLHLARLTPIPWLAPRVFGNGAVYDDGYLYTYASQSRTCAFCFAGDMYVARVPEDRIMVPSAWRYLAGSTWVADPRAGKPVLSAAVSNTDVQHYGNGFLLTTKTVNIIGPPVEAWWSPNPFGPWRDLGTVLDVPSPPPSWVPGYAYRQPYTYNPVILTSAKFDDGGFVASYDVNSFDPADARTDAKMLGPRFVSVRIPAAPNAPARPRSNPGANPWAPTFGVDTFGRVSVVDGGARFDVPVTKHAVGVARTPTARGAWVAASDGSVYAFGDAQFYGSMGAVRLNQPVVGIAATPSGNGYWLVARDGGIFSFGDARFYGSTGAIRLNRPITAMSSTPTGHGYWFVAADGGIFSFGDAHFFGSTGGAPPGFPVTGMATTPDGRGYWLVTLVGQVYTFGDAPWEGNGPLPIRALAAGIVPAPGGYRIVDSAGNVFVHTGVAATHRISRSAPLVGAG